MRFALLNLGCKVNRVESDSIAATLCSQGWAKVKIEEADVVLINTCTVTGEAEKKTRKVVRRVLRRNHYASVILTGCAVAMDSSFYTSLDKRIKVETNKKCIVACFQAIQKEKQELPPKIGGDFLRLGENFPTRVGIKVQDGCDNACTYCVVRLARGKAWSRPYEEIITEVKAYAQTGVKEIILTGIDIGSYQSEGRTIDALLQGLLEIKGETRFRISSIEPRSITPSFIECLVSAQGRICRHLHLPLQSGSSRVLSEMARPYDGDFYADLVERLYDALPLLSLSTDIIVGFPGETEDDFQETLRQVVQCHFSKIHIFPFSPRDRTAAAARNDQIIPEVKALRVRQLQELAERLRKQDYQRRQGSEELVLVEQNGWGMSESYHRVPVPEEIPTGTLFSFVFGTMDKDTIAVK